MDNNNMNNNTPEDNNGYPDPNANQDNSGYQDPNANQGGGYQDPNAGYQNPNMNYQDPNTNYQQNYNQQPYQNNYQGQNPNDYGMDTSPMELKDWIITLLIFMIPCVNIVMYFVWAFSKTGNINRRNYCRAGLVIYGIVFVIYLILFIVFGASFSALLNRGYY